MILNVSRPVCLHNGIHIYFSLLTFIPIQFNNDVIPDTYPGNIDQSIPNIDSILKLVFFCLPSNFFKFNYVFVSKIGMRQWSLQLPV